MIAAEPDGWREERRLRILDAAGSVFSRRGFADATMDEIAAEAGFGKPTIYRYFDGKDALFAAVFVSALDALERRLESVLEPDAPAGEMLAAMLAAIVPAFRDHLAAMRHVPDTSGGDRSRLRIFRERRARIARLLAAVIRTGAEAGEWRPLDAATVAEMMIGMVWSATVATRSGDAEIVAFVIDLAVGGLARRAEPALAESRRAPRTLKAAV